MESKAEVDCKAEQERKELCTNRDSFWCMNCGYNKKCKKNNGYFFNIEERIKENGY